MPIPETTLPSSLLHYAPDSALSAVLRPYYLLLAFLLTDVEQFHFAVAQKLQNWSVPHWQGPSFPSLPCLAASLLYPFPFTSFVLSVFHMIFPRKLLQKLFNIFCLSSKNWILLGKLKNNLEKLDNRKKEGTCRASHNRINKVFKS